MTLKVDFSKMTQTNIHTGWQRDVQCVPTPSESQASSSSPQGQWEWQDEDGKWNEYPPAVQRLLDACQNCGVKKCEFEDMGRCYRVESGKQIDVEYGIQRNVRYVSGDGELL